MNCARLTVSVLATFAIAAQAQATPSAQEALRHCAGIDAADARLACYDAAAGRTAPAAATTATSSPGAAPAGTTATAAAGSDPKDFGLTPAQRKVEPSGPASIQAHITGLAADRAGNAIVTLDNGQTWFVNESDARLDVGQAVTIKHAALGSFLMTTPNRRAYHVHRTR